MARGANSQVDDILYGEFSPSDHRSVLDIPMPTVPMEVWSDDGHKRVHLEDISDYLLQASDQQLEALKECNWNCDYPVDDVVYHYEAALPGLRQIIKYAEAQEIGFGAEIETDAAEEWLAWNATNISRVSSR